MAFDVSQFMQGLDEAAAKRIIPAALKAVDDFGEHVLGVAQADCPVKTGALQNSGTTLPAVMVGSAITKTIGFNTNYAAAVHENLEAHHTQGHAKYLANAILSQGPKLESFAEKEIKDAL